VEAFVRRYFERRSTPLSEEEPGVHRAMLPPALQEAFDGADSIRLAFSPEAIPSRGGVDLAVVGSYLLDRILEDATRTGWHTVAYLKSGQESPAEVLGNSLRPKNAAIEIGATNTESVPHLLFNFKVRLTTDERVERVESVLIDVRTGAERRAAPAVFEERPSLPRQDVPGGSEASEAYRAACRLLEGRIERDVIGFRDQAEALRKAEVDRITKYFKESIAEALQSKSAGGVPEARALEFERDRRMAEAEEKYRFVGDVELCNVRTIDLDVTRAEATLSHRGARRTIAVEFDAANRHVPPPPCEVCGAPADAPVLCFSGHLVDSGCSQGCALCDRVHCQTCVTAKGMIAPCGVCGRALCIDHLEVCALSQQGYCPDHILACAICGRTVGPDYVARCVSCEQTYCVACVAPPMERCATCRNLEPATTGDPAIVSLKRSDPVLARITRWRRASNSRVTILLGKGLVWNHLLVTDARGAVVVRKKVLGR